MESYVNLGSVEPFVGVESFVGVDVRLAGLSARTPMTASDVGRVAAPRHGLAVWGELCPVDVDKVASRGVDRSRVDAAGRTLGTATATSSSITSGTSTTLQGSSCWGPPV